MTDDLIDRVYSPRRGRFSFSRRGPDFSCPDPPTDYLVVRPNLLDGIASIADVFGSRWSYNYSPSEEEADARAMWLDWAVIGSDLNRAMERYSAKLAEDGQLTLEFGTPETEAEEVTAKN